MRRMARSGEWLKWSDQLFGFVLIGLAHYFLDPVVPNNLMTRILPYYAAGAGVFLGFVTPEGKSWRPFLMFRSAIGIRSGKRPPFFFFCGYGVDAPRFQPSPAVLSAAARPTGRA